MTNRDLTQWQRDEYVWWGLLLSVGAATVGALITMALAGVVP